MNNVTINDSDLTSLILRQANAIALCMAVRGLPSDPRTTNPDALADVLAMCRSLANVVLQGYGLPTEQPPLVPPLNLEEPPKSPAVLRWPPHSPDLPTLPAVYSENMYEVREAASADPHFAAGARVAFTGESEWNTRAGDASGWLMKVYLAPDFTKHMWLTSRSLKPTEEPSAFRRKS